jgi:hypothetical protein
MTTPAMMQCVTTQAFFDKTFPSHAEPRAMQVWSARIGWSARKPKLGTKVGKSIRYHLAVSILGRIVSDVSMITKNS